MGEFSEVRIKSIPHVVLEPSGLLPMPLGQQVPIDIGGDAGELSLGLGPKNGNGNGKHKKDDSDDC
jgi:hypothetical protein